MVNTILILSIYLYHLSFQCQTTTTTTTKYPLSPGLGKEKEQTPKGKSYGQPRVWDELIQVLVYGYHPNKRPQLIKESVYFLENVIKLL